THLLLKNFCFRYLSYISLATLNRSFALDSIVSSFQASRLMYSVVMRRLVYCNKESFLISHELFFNVLFNFFVNKVRFPSVSSFLFLIDFLVSVISLSIQFPSHFLGRMCSTE